MPQLNFSAGLHLGFESELSWVEDLELLCRSLCSFHFTIKSPNYHKNTSFSFVIFIFVIFECVFICLLEYICL